MILSMFPICIHLGLSVPFTEQHLLNAFICNLNVSQIRGHVSNINGRKTAKVDRRFFFLSQIFTGVRVYMHRTKMRENTSIKIDLQSSESRNGASCNG